jgi:carnosine synthase
VKALVLDAPDSWAQLMEKEGVISKFVPIDFADAEHAFDNCLKVRTVMLISHFGGG